MVCLPAFQCSSFSKSGYKAPGEINEYQAPDRAFEAYGLSPAEQDTLKRYYAVVTAIDFAVGRIMNTIDSLGIADNTFVFLYSDNGGNVPELFESGLEVASNYPLRGGRPTLYEGGIRVPAIARWPGKIKAGSVIDEQLWSPDLMPACAKLAGVSLPHDRFFDGEDPLPLLTGQTSHSPHASLFFEYSDDAALIWDDWKIIRENPQQDWQLFNLKNDISETADLSGQHQDVVQKLNSAFRQKKNEIERYLKIEESYVQK